MLTRSWMAGREMASEGVPAGKAANGVARGLTADSNSIGVPDARPPDCGWLAAEQPPSAAEAPVQSEAAVSLPKGDMYGHSAALAADVAHAEPPPPAADAADLQSTAVFVQPDGVPGAEAGRLPSAARINEAGVGGGLSSGVLDDINAPAKTPDGTLSRSEGVERGAETQRAPSDRGGADRRRGKDGRPERPPKDERRGSREQSRARPDGDGAGAGASLDAAACASGGGAGGRERGKDKEKEKKRDRERGDKERTGRGSRKDKHKKRSRSGSKERSRSRSRKRGRADRDKAAGRRRGGPLLGSPRLSASQSGSPRRRRLSRSPGSPRRPRFGLHGVPLSPPRRRGVHSPGPLRSYGGALRAIPVGPPVDAWGGPRARSPPFGAPAPFRGRSPPPFRDVYGYGPSRGYSPPRRAHAQPGSPG